MTVRRLLSAVALTAGIAVVVQGQTPPATPPATPATPPATPPGTPPAPASNPDIDKGVEEFRKGDGDKAMKHFKDAYDKDKGVKLPPPKVIMAQLLMQAQNGQQQGRALLENAGAEDPGHPDPYIFSAQIADAEGRIMDAMLLFETALTKAGDARWPVDVRQRFIRTCRIGLAKCYGNRGEYARAQVQLKNILDDEPKNASVRKDYAQLTFVFGQHDAAFEELKKAFADDPKNPAIGLPEVNMAIFWEGKPVTATDAAAVKAEAAANLAKSEEWMKKAIEVHAKDVRSFRNYGRWLMNHDRLEEADKMLATAKGLDGNDNETNAFIGLSHRYKKQYKEAEAIFDALNRLDRANIAYAWNLALCMGENADEKVRQQAVALAQTVQQGNQRSPEAAAVLAWCLYKVDRMDDADRAIGGAIQAAGGIGRLPPDNLYYLARILDKRGKGTDARDVLKRAVDSKAPFVYRKDADAFYKELVAKHGEPKTEEPKKDDKKDDKKNEPKKNP